MSPNQSKGSALTDLRCLFIPFIYFSFETGSPGWPQTDCIAKVILELFVQLPPLPECWDHKQIPLPLPYFYFLKVACG